MFEALDRAIKKYQTIIIHRHNNPDPDALGSQLGLAEIIRLNYINKQVYCVGKDLDSLAFLGKMDVIDDFVYKGALVIVMDTANQPRIDDKRFDKGDMLIKMDHHPIVDAYGEIAYVDTQASSTCELLVDFVQQHHLTLNSQAARLLYAGIVGDTGRFLYASTTVKTMQAAAFLRQYNFSATDVHYEMITQSQAVAWLSGYVLQNVQITEKGVGYVVLTQELLISYGLTDEHTAFVVSLLGTIEGIVCWGIFVEQPNGKYRCRLRSKGPVINGIAQQHDGGGHPLASGANAQDEDEIKQIIEEMNQVV